VICSVLDDGSGFREQDLPRIFEEHGGRVAAANRPEGGAIMAVKLPTGPMTAAGAA